MVEVKLIKVVDSYMTTEDFLFMTQKKLNVRFKCKVDKVEEYIKEIKAGRRVFYFYEYERFYKWLNGELKKKPVNKKRVREYENNKYYCLSDVNKEDLKIEELRIELTKKDCRQILKNMSENDLYKLMDKTNISVIILKSLQAGRYKATEIMYNKIIKALNNY